MKDTGAGIKTYRVDAQHSIVEFAIKHMMVATVRGRFLDIEGTINLDETLPTGSEVRVTIKAASVDTGVLERDNHLRSPDFFNAGLFTEIRFESSKVERIDERHFKLSGNLSLHGVTRLVTLDATLEGRMVDNLGTERIGFSAQTSLDRRDFGINWNGQMGRLVIGDEVDISLDLECRRL